MATRGQYRVGSDFNPSGNSEIEQIKGVTATLIDNLEWHKDRSPEIDRLIALAQTKYEEACMFAVKAVAYANKPILTFD